MERVLSAKDSVMLNQFVSSAVEIRFFFEEIKRIRKKEMGEGDIFGKRLEILSKKTLGFYRTLKTYIQSPETAYLMQEKLARTYNIDFSPLFDELCIQEFTAEEQMKRMVLSSLYLRQFEISVSGALKDNHLSGGNAESNEECGFSSGSFHFNSIYAAILEREILKTTDDRNLANLFVDWLYDTLYCCASLRKFWSLESGRLYPMDEALSIACSARNSELNDGFILDFLCLSRAQANALLCDSDFAFKRNVAYSAMRMESCMLMLSDDMWTLLRQESAENPNEPVNAGDLAYSQAIANTIRTKQEFAERNKMLVEVKEK